MTDRAPTNEPRPFEGSTGGLAVLARAALPTIPGVNRLPGVRKRPEESFGGLAFTRPAVTVARSHVDAYAEVTGFPHKDTAPVTYPHMLAFPLHMAIMSDPAFPYPAIGTVHLENSIISRRPVRIGETLTVRAGVEPARPHPKGVVLDFVTHAFVGDEPVWESTSTYLRRGRGTEGAPRGLDLDDVAATGTRWHLPADLGRRYAAVSGDRNPIHLYPLTARALGFKRQIAHGMWTKARCLAALENRLPDAVGIEVSFRKPVFLPGTVAFGSEPTDDGYAFSLRDPRSEALHLLGRTLAL